MKSSCSDILNNYLQINEIRPDGTERQYHLENIARPTHISVDWISKNLYVFDARSGRIDIVYIKSENEIYQSNVISDNLGAIGAMALDPLSGYEIAFNKVIFRSLL